MSHQDTLPSVNAQRILLLETILEHLFLNCLDLYLEPHSHFSFWYPHSVCVYVCCVCVNVAQSVAHTP